MVGSTERANVGNGGKHWWAIVDNGGQHWGQWYAIVGETGGALSF